MFIQKEFDENDGRAKNKLRTLLMKHPKYSSCTLVEPSDPFTVDFYVKNKKGEHVANIEVEVKKTWKGSDFKYNDIQLLPRKKKFWTEERYHKGKPTMFVMFNIDLTNHLVILSDKMEEIFSKNNTRHYGTEKTRDDAFFIAKKSEVTFGYFDAPIPVEVSQCDEQSIELL